VTEVLYTSGAVVTAGSGTIADVAVSGTSSVVKQILRVPQTANNTNLTSTVQWTDYPNLTITISATAGNTLLVQLQGIFLVTGAQTAFLGVHINGVVTIIGGNYAATSTGMAGSASAVVATTGAQVVKIVYYVVSGAGLYCRAGTSTSGEMCSVIVTEHS
jgi:hypothetical protein